MVNLFCSRCFNYVDFCDCINYEYDLEDYTDRSIPRPPEPDPPEVGTVWYFRIPLQMLHQILREQKAEKVGLDLLLRIPDLWTLEPMPDPEYYLSVPIDRLPLNSPDPGDIFTPGTDTYDKYVPPWEFNYYNTSTGITDVATLAEKLMRCNAKRTAVGRNICRMKEMGISFIDEFNMSGMEVPPQVLEDFSLLPPGSIDPAIAATIILAVLPENVVEHINDLYKPAIDYSWVHQHLIDTTDPPEGYEDYQGTFMGCLLNLKDCANQTTDFDTTQYAQDKPKGSNVVTPERTDYSDLNLKPILIPRPLNPNVIPHEPDDIDEYPPINRKTLFTDYNYYPYNNAVQLYKIPPVFSILSYNSVNQTATIGASVLRHEYDSVTNTIKTQLVTQQSYFVTVNGVEGNPYFIFVACVEAGRTVGSTITRTFNFTHEPGQASDVDGRIRIQVPGQGAITIGTQTGTSASYAVNFVVKTTKAHFVYTAIQMRGFVQGTVDPPVTVRSTIWNITCTDLSPTNVKTTVTPMNKLTFKPSVLSYTNEGWITSNSLIQQQNGSTPRTIHRSAELQSNAIFNIPVCVRIRNEVNLEAYSPNGFVNSKGTIDQRLGYATGAGGGVGGAGTLHLIYNPVGHTNLVKYKIGLSKSQGQTQVMDIYSFST